MTRRETFQVSSDAAEVYESRFVPALFAQWAPLVVEQAAVAEGQRILDVACGTGVVARVAADRVGPHGRAVGLDLNAGMLAVARRIRPDLGWCLGDAGALPFPDDPGGATKHGVMLGTLRGLGADLNGDRRIDVADVKALTPDKAAEIYVRHYCHAPRIDLLPEPLRLRMAVEELGGQLRGFVDPSRGRTIAFRLPVEADAASG